MQMSRGRLAVDDAEGAFEPESDAMAAATCVGPCVRGCPLLCAVLCLWTHSPAWSAGCADRREGPLPACLGPCARACSSRLHQTVIGNDEQLRLCLESKSPSSQPGPPAQGTAVPLRAPVKTGSHLQSKAETVTSWCLGLAGLYLEPSKREKGRCVRSSQAILCP